MATMALAKVPVASGGTFANSKIEIFHFLLTCKVFVVVASESHLLASTTGTVATLSSIAEELWAEQNLLSAKLLSRRYRITRSCCSVQLLPQALKVEGATSSMMRTGIVNLQYEQRCW